MWHTEKHLLLSLCKTRKQISNTFTAIRPSILNKLEVSVFDGLIEIGHDPAQRLPVLPAGSEDGVEELVVAKEAEDRIYPGSGLIGEVVLDDGLQARTAVFEDLLDVGFVVAEVHLRI